MKLPLVLFFLCWKSYGLPRPRNESPHDSEGPESLLSRTIVYQCKNKCVDRSFSLRSDSESAGHELSRLGGTTDSTYALLAYRFTYKPLSLLDNILAMINLLLFLFLSMKIWKTIVKLQKKAY